jgi:hypothetical protein
MRPGNGAIRTRQPSWRRRRGGFLRRSTYKAVTGPALPTLTVQPGQSFAGLEASSTLHRRPATRTSSRSGSLDAAAGQVSPDPRVRRRRPLHPDERPAAGGAHRPRAIYGYSFVVTNVVYYPCYRAKLRRRRLESTDAVGRPAQMIVGLWPDDVSPVVDRHSLEVVDLGGEDARLDAVDPDFGLARSGAGHRRGGVCEGRGPQPVIVDRSS